MKSATKIFGWGLLILGLLIICWTLYSSYNIFTGKGAVPPLFKTETEQISAQIPEGQFSASPGEIQEQAGKILGEQLKAILPAETLPKTLNLIVWSILAGILIFGGSQISSLGIKLLRK